MMTLTCANHLRERGSETLVASEWIGWLDPICQDALFNLGTSLYDHHPTSDRLVGDGRNNGVECILD